MTKQAPRKPKLEKAVYSAAEVAAIMDIHLQAAYDLARQEGFPAVRIGRRIVIPKAAFHRWLENVAG